MIKQILLYLSSADPDFERGFALFCQCSRNRTAIDWIRRRHDMPKLLYELQKLADNPSLKAAPTSAESPIEAAPVNPAEPAAEVEKPMQYRTFDDRRTKRSDLPLELQVVYDEISDMYKLRRALHEKMKLAKTDSDRSEYRARVIEADGMIRERWLKIDNYLAAKEKEQLQENFNESTCRSYICKALKRESNSVKQVATCRERVKALIDHGCTIDSRTMEQLQQKGLC